MDAFIDIGTYRYSPAERARFFTGALLNEWQRAHRDVLFDSHDVTFAAGPKLRHGKSWHEWKAAVVLHRLTGFHALVTRYQQPGARRKQRLLRQLMSPALWTLLMEEGRLGRAQGPDLIMFDPRDHERWLFVETKKRGERFTAKQQVVFPALAREAQRPVCVLTFEAAASEEDADCWVKAPTVDALAGFATAG